MPKELVKQSKYLGSSVKLLILGAGFSGQRVAVLAKKLGATVLCSELSLMAAQTRRGELTRSHMVFERNNEAINEFKGEKLNVSNTPINIIVKPASVPTQLMIEKTPSNGSGEIFSRFQP